MAKDLSLDLTEASTGNQWLINDGKIVVMVWDTLGSRIIYNDNGAKLKEKIVSESNAAVAALSEMLIDLTDAASGSTIYFSTNRIVASDGTTISVDSDTLGTTFTYDNGMLKRTYTVTEDVDVVRQKVANK